ncbi:WD repeat-containing protein jip5 [Agyrium rufum]|nr:WD repeat-containing protein jip5 [Agyrium rufum]
MLETLCTLPLTSDLFAQALSPSEPILSVGLASGHVETFRLPSDPSQSGPTTARKGAVNSPNGSGTAFISTAWRTKRHKGSCRSLAFSHDGQDLYSAGADGIVKIAKTDSGKVNAKIAIPFHQTTLDPPTVLHALSPQTLLLATDSSALHIYDLRTPAQPASTYHPHEDYVSSITSLPPTLESTSGFPKQVVTIGGTTLAVTDFRRGVLVQSDDQETELLCGCMVSGLPAKRGRGVEKVLVGDGDGVVTLWERGEWVDQEDRVYVGLKGGDESADCMIAVPEGNAEGKGSKSAVIGLANGKVKVMDVRQRKIVREYTHDDIEGVIAIDFDTEGRMISGGGNTVKVWSEKLEEEVEEEVESGEESEIEVDGESPGSRVNGLDPKRSTVSSDDSDDSDDSHSDDEEESGGRRRRKKKRRRGKEKTEPPKAVMAFKGLD